MLVSSKGNDLVDNSIGGMECMECLLQGCGRRIFCPSTYYTVATFIKDGNCSSVIATGGHHIVGAAAV